MRRSAAQLLMHGIHNASSLSMRIAPILGAPSAGKGLAFLTSTVAQHTSSGAFKLAASGFCNACSNGSRLNMPARPGLVPSSCPLTAGIVQQQLHQQQQHLVDLTGVQQSLLSPGLALRHTAVATAAAATAAAAAAAAAETVRVVQPRCLHTSQPVARTVRIPEAEAVENDNDNDDVYPGTEDEDEMEVYLDETEAEFDSEWVDSEVISEVITTHHNVDSSDEYDVEFDETEFEGELDDLSREDMSGDER